MGYGTHGLQSVTANAVTHVKQIRLGRSCMGHPSGKSHTLGISVRFLDWDKKGGEQGRYTPGQTAAPLGQCQDVKQNDTYTDLTLSPTEDSFQQSAMHVVYIRKHSLRFHTVKKLHLFMSQSCTRVVPCPRQRDAEISFATCSFSSWV